ncbi:MAG: GGDEF domain-containing protein [Spirulina sp. SIO3F2]|nr:GGDEF domain-containing protein [Spirulina sp. SIO3F2]
MKKLELLKVRTILEPLYKNKLLFDGAIAGSVVVVVCSFAATFDLNEQWIEWAEQYEQWEIDELPLSLSIFAFAMVWFAWRRLQDLKATNRALYQTQQSLLSEIAQRKQAEKLEAEIRQKVEGNMRIQQARNARDAAIQEMGEFLMFAHHKAEIINIAIRRTQAILPFESGAIYEYQGETLRHLQGWGELTQEISVDRSKNYTCWAGRRCQIHIETCPDGVIPLCARAVPGIQVVCVPILTPKGIWGVFHFCRVIHIIEEQQELGIDIKEINHLAKAITDTLGLHLHNLFLKEQLTIESTKDPLTGILNRRGFKQTLNEHGLLQQPKVSFAVLIFDIDYFKIFNDCHGHDKGDQALISVVQVVRDVIRTEDIFCRHGGEEFVIVFPNIYAEVATERAEQIRSLVEHKVIKIGQNQFKNLTISIGIALYPEHGDTYEVLLKHADQALYAAKQHGRNQVVHYGHLL